MTERINVSQLTGAELEKLRRGQVGQVVRERAQPQAPYGKPQEVPQQRKSEVEKKHDKRDGRG